MPATTPLPPASRWGVYLFVPSVLAGIAVLFIPWWFAPREFRALYDSGIPWTGLALSVLAFFVGHFSYPRVHNLKVYLIGYLTGLMGVAWFLLITPPVSTGFTAPSSGVITCLTILALVNIAFVASMPSYAKYRMTKILTLWIMGMEALIVATLRFIPEATRWTRYVAFDEVLDPGFWIGPVIWGSILAISIRWLRDDFHLGGVLAGSSFLYLLAWATPVFLAEPAHTRTVLFAAAPLVLEIGIVIHWFLRIEHRVSYDPLLHIYNRNYCSKIIEEQSNINSLPPFTVGMVDIDHFKKVNDTYGHQAGDLVLVNTAQTICREVVPDGIVCRYGGEEMAVFFPQTTAKQAVEVMERVRKKIEAVTTLSRNKKIKVTISIGVAQRDDRAQSIIDVIHAADKALYRAKEGGRNQVRTGKTAAPGAKKKGSKEAG